MVSIVGPDKVQLYPDFSLTGRRIVLSSGQTVPGVQYARTPEEEGLFQEAFVRTFEEATGRVVVSEEEVWILCAEQRICSYGEDSVDHYGSRDDSRCWTIKVQRITLGGVIFTRQATTRSWDGED